MNEWLGMGAGAVIILTFVGAVVGKSARGAWTFVRRLVLFLDEWDTFVDQWKGPPSIPERIDAIEKRQVNGS